MAIHPAWLKNGFFSHACVYVFFLPLLLLIFCPFAAGTVSVSKAETQLVVTFGQHPVSVSRNTTSAFKRAFVDTGIFRATRRFFAGGRNPFLKNRPREEPGSPAAHGQAMEQPPSKPWIDNFWAYVFKTVMRFYAFYGVMLAAAVVSFCAWLDAFLNEKGRKPLSPARFNGYSHAAVAAAGMLFLMPFYPFSVSWVTLVLPAVLLPVFAWLAVSSAP